MNHPLFDLTGKVALVTGATHGLGMAMASGLASAGATLIINGNSSQEKIDNAVNEYREKGFKAFGYKFNVTDEDQVIAAVDQIEKDHGPIDILVNNAGIIKHTPAGKWGDPDDLQGATIFLASKASDFVTRQIVYVDGGILATIGEPSNEA